MIEIKVNGQIVSIQNTLPLYSGSADVHECRFTFDKSWDGFKKSAVFRVGDESHTKLVDENNCCIVPWELLTHRSVGKQVEIGVYGVSADTEIMTSVWDTLGVIREGAEPGDDVRNPVDGIYEQILAKMQGVHEAVDDYDAEMRDLIRRAETAAKLASDSAETAVTDLEALEELLKKYGGVPGETGNGIEYIKRTDGDGMPGSTDTYAVVLTDGSEYGFTVHNGADGQSAYAYAVNAGFAGTEQAFADKLAAEYYTTDEVDEKVEKAQSAADTANRKADTLREVVSKFHSNIVEKADGEIVTVHDSSDLGLAGLKLFGKTTQDGEPTPDAPVPLVSVGDGGSVGVTVCGKNLLQNSAISVVLQGVTFTVEQDGSVVVNGTAQESAYLFINSFNYGDGEGEYILSGCPAGGSVKTYRLYDDVARFFDTGDGVKISGNVEGRIYICISAGQTVSNLVFRPMIRPASIADDAYEPYIAQTLITQTPNGLPGIPVAAGGNYTDANGQRWVCDEVDFARGVYVQRVTKKIFNGTEAWGTKHIGSGIIHNCNVIDVKQEDSSSNLRCSHFEADISGTWYHTANACYFQGREFRVCHLGIDTAEEYRIWLTDNPITVQYILATPIETALTAEEIAAFKALHSNKPNTTVYNDDDAGMAVEYIADTKIYIDNKFTELQNAILSAGANV